MNKSKVTIGLQAGDEDSGSLLQPIVIILRKFIEKYFNKVYSEEINEFSIIFRVSGKLWHLEQEGCDRLKRSKKEKYITIDIYIPEDKWQRDLQELKKFISINVVKAFNLFIEKIKKDKVSILEDELRLDMNNAIEMFNANS